MVLSFVEMAGFATLNVSIICSREKLEAEVAAENVSNKEVKPMPKTALLVNGLLERLNLLLHVTIAPEGGGITRSVSHMPEKSTSKSRYISRSILNRKYK